MPELFYLYMLATRKDGPLYGRVTNDLHRRVWEHQTHAIRGVTAKYNVDRLVYVEVFESVGEAIAREKRVKKWHRAWKAALIGRENPDWLDLSERFAP